MIELLRVDSRLLHGQVVFSWISYLKADCILIANDLIVSDEFQKNTMRLSKPQNAKLIFKTVADSAEAINSGVSDKYRMLILTSCVADAARLADSVAAISTINLGGTKATRETISLSKLVNATREEVEILNGLVERGVEVEMRGLPTDAKILYKRKLM